MIVWWNGALTPIEAVRISPLDRGFIYGDGVFETIRIQDGKPLWLSEHLERFKRSLKLLNFGSTADFFEEERVRRIIHDLLKANPAMGNVTRLKIIVTRGENSLIGLPAVDVDFGQGFSSSSPTVLFTVTSYQPPSEDAYRRGWAVELIAGHYSPPLGRHKTLNYLFYLWLKEEARKKGFQEAIFEDCEGRIVEASTASLAVLIDGVWVFPVSYWKLDGITEKIVSRLLQEMNESVAFKELRAEDLVRARAMWLLNSMIGVMPVNKINERYLPERMESLAAKIREGLFLSNK